MVSGSSKKMMRAAARRIRIGIRNDIWAILRDCVWAVQGEGGFLGSSCTDRTAAGLKIAAT